ncbi:MAG TPA: DUF4097 family beta strand repeat-containing protein [Microlunatus sp.]
MSTIDIAYDDVKSIMINNVGSGGITVGESADGKTTGAISCADPEFLEQATVHQSHDQLRITMPQWRFHSPQVYVELAVPAGTGLVTSTGSADVNIQVRLGETKINTGSGDVGVSEAETLRCNTGSGDISVGTLTGSGSDLNSGSGDVSIDRASANLQAKSASGDVRVREFDGTLRANTASGDIDVPSAAGVLELRTASGSVSVGVAGGLPAWLDVNSVSGEVDISLEASAQPAAGEPFVSIKASTASGDISIFRA